jgi:uncharacterized protein
VTFGHRTDPAPGRVATWWSAELLTADGARTEVPMDDTDALALVDALYRAFEDRDHQTLLELLDEEVRWQQAARWVPGAGSASLGRQEALDRVIAPLEDDWDGFTEDVEELIPADGTVIATGVYRGTYRATGRSLRAEFCHLWRIRDGRVVAFRQFTDTAAFAEAMTPGLEAGHGN